MKLWYKQEAKHWVEALPLGNGRMGAMVYGNPVNEVVSLNEDTLWSGYPRDTNNHEAHKYLKSAQELVLQGKLNEAQSYIEKNMLSKFTQTYLPFGDISLDFLGLNKEEITDYKRELSLDNAMTTTTYNIGGIVYTQQMYISNPANCMVIKLSADKKQSISVKTSFVSQLRYESDAHNDRIVINGICPSQVRPSYVESENPIVYEDDDHKKGISFASKIVVDNIDGEIKAEDNAIVVQNASEVYIKIFIRTSFNGYDKHPYLDGKDYISDCNNDILLASKQSYDQLLAEHIADYQRYYKRVELSFEKNDFDEVPTDVRLIEFQKTQNDSCLYELIFNFGRYLLISSSREGTQPANLQGIWNKELQAPWSSNYTVNINTQMNYWPALSCNMLEMQQPLNKLIEELRDTGAKTAKYHYNANGITAHHNVDLWRLSNPVGEDREGSAGYACWPMSYGWLCRHLFEQYEYNLDIDFLRDKAYPAILGATQFYVDMLVADENGYLCIIPSNSPENTFIYEGKRCNISKNTTMSTAIVKEVFTNFIKCCELLGITGELLDTVKAKIEKLYPYEIGSQGQLLEWDKEYEEPEIQHRHISHLYGLYPANEINPYKSEELVKACKRTLEIRGDVGTGWSLGWKINVWARMLDGDHALKLLKRQLSFVDQNRTDYMNGGGTYMNLFDAHPPFQIDGNFAATAGVNEMLLQSYDDRVLILPALPSELPNGYIKGLCAKGGITANIYFKDGKLEKAEINVINKYNKQYSKDVTFVYNNREIKCAVKNGDIITLYGEDFS